MKALALMRRRSDRGFSLIELLIVIGILSVLAGAAVPLAKVTMQRQREIELRRSLREIRTAIDHYKDAVDLGVISRASIETENDGYPPDLKALVDGATLLEDETGRKIRFLRRIPTDPFTQDRDWGLRSYQDEPDSNRWSGNNVYDVYSQSNGIALDGTRYRQW